MENKKKIILVVVILSLIFIYTFLIEPEKETYFSFDRDYNCIKCGESTVPPETRVFIELKVNSSSPGRFTEYVPKGWKIDSVRGGLVKENRIEWNLGEGYSKILYSIITPKEGNGYFVSHFGSTTATSDVSLEEPYVHSKGMNSITYSFNDGLYKTEIHKRPINYYTDGEWKKIDKNIVEVLDGVFSYHATGVFDVFFKEKVGPGMVEIRNADLNLSYFPVSLEYSKNNERETISEFSGGSTVINNNIITYVLDENVNISYIYKTNLVKERIIIDSLPDEENVNLDINFVFNIGEHLDVYVDDKHLEWGPATGQKITLKKDSGRVFEITPPTFEDAIGQIGQPFYNLYLEETTIYLSIRTFIPKISDLVFPIEIDPTVYVDVEGTGNTDGYLDCYSDTIQCTSMTRYNTTETSHVGRESYSGNYILYRGWFDFDTSSIPDAADIKDVDLNLTVYSITGPSQTFTFSHMDSKASEYNGSYGAGNDTDLWTDIDDGTEYVTNTDAFSSLGENIVDLGTSADSDLKNQLNEDWFGLGMTGEEYTDDEYTLFVQTENSSSEWHPVLAITYRTDPTVTLNSPGDASSQEAGDVTFNCTGSDTDALDTVLLYGNWSSYFVEEDSYSNIVTDSYTFISTHNIPDPGWIIWNCFYNNTNSQSAFAPSNYSLELTTPSVTNVTITNEKYLDWGTGTVTEGKQNCTLDTNGNLFGCTGFAAIETPPIIENFGNTNVSLYIATNVSSQEMIGGTNPLFQWRIEEYNANSCYNSTGGTSGQRAQESWVEANTTAPGNMGCPWFRHESTVDELYMWLEAHIPSDASSKRMSSLIILTATVL